MSATSSDRPARVFLVATEASGDRLGAALIRALRGRLADAVEFSGVGGEAMRGAGLTSIAPIEELGFVGFASIPRRLPLIFRRISDVSERALLARPDVLVIIDSPDFTHRVARRVRARDASIPIVDYVSPSVWAWRPGRAKAMSRYIDHVLALLPFEPQVHRELGGPPCTYVGHPLLGEVAELRPSAEEAQRRNAEPPVLLVLPGSRRSEIRRHMGVFGETLHRLREGGTAFEPVIPTLPRLAEQVREASRNWPVAARVVVGEQERLAVIRIARAALSKSGTSTLELALAGVPLVGAYRVSGWEAFIARRVARVQTVILANLVLGENIVPEYLQEACTADSLAPALADIIRDGPVRQRQLDAFARLDGLMATQEHSPGEAAADIVIRTMREGRAARDA
jgi:lipid-A-disaccharide synthase